MNSPLLNDWELTLWTAPNPLSLSCLLRLHMLIPIVPLRYLELKLH